MPGFMAKLEVLTPRKHQSYYKFSIRFGEDLVVRAFRYYPEEDKLVGPRMKGHFRGNNGMWRKREFLVVEVTPRFKAELLRQCRKRWGQEAEA